MARSRRALPPGWCTESQYKAHWEAHKPEHPQYKKMLKKPKPSPRVLLEAHEIIAGWEPQRPDLIEAAKTFRFYITEHSEEGEWRPAYEQVEKETWEWLGKYARDYSLQFKATGIKLQHAAARVAAETRVRYPRMRDGRTVRDERGHQIYDEARVVPGPSWKAVITRIERAAENLSQEITFLELKMF